MEKREFIKATNGRAIDRYTESTSFRSSFDVEGFALTTRVEMLESENVS
jgi:hypothetical protein